MCRRSPLTVQPLSPGAPAPDFGAPKAVILPSRLVVAPPEELRTWLAAFSGQRLVIPGDEDGYVWSGTTALSPDELARQAAITLRQMAEGQPLRVSPPPNAWMITGYVLGGLFGLILLGFLTALVVSSFSR